MKNLKRGYLVGIIWFITREVLFIGLMIAHAVKCIKQIVVIHKKGYNSEKEYDYSRCKDIYIKHLSETLHRQVFIKKQNQ